MLKKEKIQISVTAGLILVLLFLIINTAGKASQKKSSEMKSVGASESKSSQNRPSVKELFDIQEKEANALELKRNPFAPAPIISTESAAPTIQLNGIIWDKVNPTAIINGDIVKVGSKVGDNIVVAITPNSVTLNDGNREYKLQLEY